MLKISLKVAKVSHMQNIITLQYILPIVSCGSAFLTYSQFLEHKMGTNLMKCKYSTFSSSLWQGPNNSANKHLAFLLDNRPFKYSGQYYNCYLPHCLSHCLQVSCLFPQWVSCVSSQHCCSSNAITFKEINESKMWHYLVPVVEYCAVR